MEPSVVGTESVPDPPLPGSLVAVGGVEVGDG
jgi:hypothetical protein